MTKKELVLKYLAYDNVEALDHEDQQYFNQAEQMLDQAYAPYSQFKVSALVVLENGEVVTGTNQENVAYPSGICAERVAMFYAHSKFPGVPVSKIILVTAKEADNPFTPCGACRQVMVEFQQLQASPIKVMMKSGNSIIWEFQSVRHLLPFMFNATDLLKKD